MISLFARLSQQIIFKENIKCHDVLIKMSNVINGVDASDKSYID